MGVVAHNINESYPAIAASVPVARRDVALVAAEAGASDEQIENIRLAVSEALTNVVVHAYPGTPGMIHVTVAAVSGELWVLIGDDGCGLEVSADRPGLGLGLAVIAHTSDDFTIATRAAGGTEVRMRFDLVDSDGAQTAPGRKRAGQLRGSVTSALTPASSSFSTTT